MEERITLYSSIEDDQNILIELYFDDVGNLVFDGYDVKNIIDDDPRESKYQFTYTIKEEELCKLYCALHIMEGDQTVILQTLKERFGGPDAFLLVRRFMYRKGIPFSVFAWP
jgi:hypothetical protein